MAIYPVKNLKTGEMKELQMTLAQYEEWRDSNPDWDKDWNAGVCDAVSGVGDYQDKLPMVSKTDFVMSKNIILTQNSRLLSLCQLKKRNNLLWLD